MVEIKVFKRIQNESGSMMISTLALAGVIAITAAALISSLSNQMKIQSRNGSIEDVRNLGTAVQMLFAEASSCSQNLVAKGFGTNFNQLKSKLSYNGNIQLYYPKNGPLQGVFIEPQKTFQKVKIQSIGFTKIKQVAALAGTYLADLRIQATDFYGHQLQPITVPFYVSTNSAGAITSCFATSYPYESDPKMDLQTMTLEDVLCKQTAGGNTVYLSSEQTCIAKPTVIGSL